MQYAIVAYAQHTDSDGWAGTTRLPTFYLDSNVQGIVSADHAARIAAEMLANIATPGSHIVAAASSHDDTGTACRMSVTNGSVPSAPCHVQGIPGKRLGAQARRY